MRKQGSVTVTFSLVFVLLFGFILSFFEMASHTARAAYHASAGRLAVENFFAGYTAPLFEEYHIFGREVSGEDKTAFAENEIGADVSYMTMKQEGERSLLLRNGAEFGVDSVRVLTDDSLEGFYGQAVTSMKYRGITEIVDTLKKFGDVSEQANAQLEVATAKAETDMAYGKVDERILQLITLIDGVNIVQYEKFLNGDGVIFQEDAYVKYFCVAPETAVNYFDRTEVYQAFLDNHENPKATLEALYKEVSSLATEVEERELHSANCQERLTELQGLLDEVNAQIEGLEAKDAETEDAKDVNTETEDEKEELLKQYNKEKEQYENEKESLERLKEALDQQKEEQEKQAAFLKLRELVFTVKSERIREICEEAYSYVGELQKELKTAKSVRTGCETLVSVLQPVIGTDTAKEYREELNEYTFYEDLEGYDFDRMKQTLLDNKSRLMVVKPYVTGTDSGTLKAAAEGLLYELQFVSKYSFEGLKLNYGEMTLQESLYEGVEETIAGAVAEGYLSFLTNKTVSTKAINTAELPSGFRAEADGGGVFSLLGGNMDDVFGGLRDLLPEDTEAGADFSGISDAVLFHAYLMTHFSNYLDGNEDGALSYEQEYLIIGNETDEQNLAAVAMRICAIRTVLHFVSLYTDSARKAPVELAALAACGAIGLPALKSILVFAMLFAWALEEAMVDTAALMLGKKVALYPGKDDGSISFSETLTFSKSFVHKKAEQKKDVKGLGFGYKEFLHLFMFMTSRENKKYRALDLIQENLRKTYSDDFRVNRCVWEIRYRIDGKSYKYSYE